MAASILGKRSRPVFEEVSPTSPRSRKRVHILEDGNSSGTESRESDDATAPSTSSLHLPVATIQTTSANFAIPCASNVFKEPAEGLTPIPHTPRHRDALSKRVPITPRHRLVVGARSYTPSTPRTPSTPTTNTRTIYSEARKLFTRGADAGALVGREKERAEISNFITTRVESRTGGCLYVSGPPGTGKSALVTDICRGYDDTENVRHVYINCMSIKSPGDVYALAAAELGASTATTQIQDALKTLFLQKQSKTSYIVVLDEIDSLLALDLATLYALFDWAFSPHSKLILIGIANALDLTDRFLPRLKARNLKPELLPFLPYTATEIASVLTAKCRSLLPSTTTSNDVPAGFVPILHPTAIQLIAKKVAAQTGDLRKSFDLAQRVIDLVEAETRAAADAASSPSIKSPLSENPNISSPKKIISPHSSSPLKSQPGTSSTPQPSTQLQDFTAITAPRATLAHVTRITSTLFATSALTRLQALTLQQKAILFALVALEGRCRSDVRKQQLDTPPRTPSKRGQGQVPTVRMLHAAYNTVCKRDNVLPALSGTEFGDVLGGLETAGIVVGVDGKRITGRSGPGAVEKRVSACVGVGDCEAAAEGVGKDILRGILYGDGF